MSGARLAAPAALALLALTLAAGVAFSGCAAPARPPNIVLIVVDTVRADRLSCYGYPRPTTPHIDTLCARGIRFDDVSSTSSWTLPAHASLFTGLLPSLHKATQEHTRLDGGPATLAELLGARGYATLGVSANPVVSVGSGLARGFDAFAETWTSEYRAAGLAAMQHPNRVAVQRLLEEVPPDEPFFLFVNFIEAHGPYDPPEPHRSRFLRVPPDAPIVASARSRGTAPYYLGRAPISEREFAVLSDLYDGEVARVDELVGELLSYLEESGRMRDTLLVLTSDHGENLGDHGHFRHVFSLYRTTVHVPLVLVLPDGSGAGEVRSEPASLLDLFATLLAAAGAPVPPGSGGRDLRAPPAAADGDAPIFAEYYYPLQALELFRDAGPPEETRAVLRPYLRRLRSVEQGGLRFVWSSDGRHELYDLAEDPGEQENLVGAPPLAERQRRLDAELDSLVERAGGPTPLPELGSGGPPTGAFGDLDPDSAERLRELGYLP